MEDQLVGFELAKLAKEKGFKEYTTTGYAQNGDIYLHQGGQESVITGQKYFEGSSYKGSPFLCSRPTQNLLQKWLREVHKIHLHICYFPETKKWNVDIYKYENDNGLMNNPLEFSNNNTYEEALEQGLLQALTLIK